MAGDADITDVSVVSPLIHSHETLFVLIFTLPSLPQFDNLILDETTIERLSADDKTYLEQFAKLEMISLNTCRM